MKYIFFILFITCCQMTIAQNVNKSADDLLNQYLEKREDVKRVGTKKISEEDQNQLDELVDEMGKVAPGSFQHKLAQYINGNYDFSQKALLLDAYEQAPNDNRVLNEMFAYYSIAGDQKKMKEFGEKIAKNYSFNVYQYYLKVFPSNENSFVIVSGRQDAYPLLIIQSTKNVMTEVGVICLDFMQNDGYRKNTLLKLGRADMKFTGNEANFLEAAVKSKKEVHVSSTVPQQYMANVMSNMYLVGLTYRYYYLQQETALTSFWNSLNSSDIFSKDLKGTEERNLYANFLPPLITLYKMRANQGNQDVDLKKSIDLIATKTKRTKLVEGIMKDF